MLDQVDLQILDFLKQNSRMPFLNIAKKLSISESTVRKRVKKLQAKGVIRAFTLDIDRSLIFQSIVAVKCKSKATKNVVKKLREIDKLMPIYEVTGRFDIFFILSAPTSRELNKNIDKARDMAGVVETESFIIIEKN